MRAYVLTTGVVFGLIVLAHVARVIAEGWQRAMDPGFMLTTALAVSMFLWAMRLLLPSTRS